MHPEASIAAGLAPLSQTLVAPVQHVSNWLEIPGDTALQSPGAGACALHFYDRATVPNAPAHSSYH